MSDFEKELQHAAQKAAIKVITDGSWLTLPYESRVKIPPSWLVQVWSLVDAEKLKQQLARRIEDELADKIIHHIADEIAEDIKKILSVEERREAIRGIARQHMHEIMQAGEK